MAKTANYDWPLPSPTGNQMAEIGRIASTISGIDSTFASFEQRYSTHTHRFGDLQDRPTTLGGYGITDGMTAVEVATAIKNATDDLINGSGTALDTLKELADALGNNPNFAASVSTALGLRVRADAAQGFSAAQKAQARTNIDALGTPDKGAANGVAPLGTDAKVPQSYLPALTTTATVGAAMAAATAKATPAEGDFFTGHQAGGSTMFRTTWANIKAALQGFFDGRYLRLVGGNLTGNLLTIGQSIYIQNAGNRHLWFRDEDGSEKGLIYSQASDNSVRVRVNGARYFNFNTDGSFTLSGDVTTAGILSGSGGQAVDVGTNYQEITGIKRFRGPNTNIGENADQALTVMAGGSSTDTFMSFLSNGNYRVQLGVRSDRYFYRGGGTLGAVAYRIHDMQNLPQGDANSILNGGGTFRVYSEGSLLSAINNRAYAYANDRMFGFGGGYTQFSWGASESKWQNTTGKLVFLYFTYDVGAQNRSVTWTISDGDNGNWQSIGSNSAGARTIVVPPGFWIRGTISGSGASITLRMYW